jgi:hypothetical protein
VQRPELLYRQHHLSWWLDMNQELKHVRREESEYTAMEVLQSEMKNRRVKGRMVKNKVEEK